MFFYILISSLFQISCQQISNQQIFNDYLSEYHKHYNKSEYLYRYNIFNDNYEYINNFNYNNKNSYQLGVNNFTDLTRDEFKNKYLLRNKVVNKHASSYLNFNGDIQNSIDWRARGVVTPVKDQGQCGSCWAFSAIGAIEGQYAISTTKLVSLSEQNLVDCSTVNEGCDGGWPDKAMDYVVNNGVDTESSYPYVGTDQSCEFNSSYIGANISKVIDIQSGNMTALYYALGHIGPISVAIDVEYDFQFYKSGIFQTTQCSSQNLDHAVLAVGYGEFNGTTYIMIKNSWGVDWGMDGYIYFSTMIDNMCGIATAASYPIV